MAKSSQQRALANYRSRLSQKGMVRFEVTGRAEDRDLVRTVARTLAEEGADAERLRSALQQGLDREAPRRGGILAALRASPLVDADLDLTRPRETGRPVDL